MSGTTPSEATLLDVLIDGFEKNEMLDGFHWRTLPLPDEASAAGKFVDFAAEATRWKGAPTRFEPDGPRRIAAWDDFEIRQAGRGVMVRIRRTGFHRWWNETGMWAADPMGPVWAWIMEDRPRDGHRSTQTR